MCHLTRASIYLYLLTLAWMDNRSSVGGKSLGGWVGRVGRAVPVAMAARVARVLQAQPTVVARIPDKPALLALSALLALLATMGLTRVSAGSTSQATCTVDAQPRPGADGLQPQLRPSVRRRAKLGA